MDVSSISGPTGGDGLHGDLEEKAMPVGIAIDLQIEGRKIRVRITLTFLV
jgi:hypothetical protein